MNGNGGNVSDDNNRRRLVLCTVGVSLLDKLRDTQNGLGLINEHRSLVKYFKASNLTPREIAELSNVNEEFAEISRRVVESLGIVWQSRNFSGKHGNVLEQAIKNARSKGPAEIASLHDLLRESGSHSIDGGFRNIVVFLCSDTREGAFCARCLRDFLVDNANGEPWASSCEHIVLSGEVEGNLGGLLGCGGIIIVNNLHIDDAGRFREEGLGNLVDVIAQIMNRASEGVSDFNETSLVATGGYKPESIYAFITGSLFGMDVYYLHEESMSNLKMPVLPVDHDVITWAEYKDILALIDRHGGVEPAGLLTSLPESLRRLFEEVGGRFKLNPFGRILSELMEERLTYFSRYGKGLLLTDRVKDDDLRRLLEGNIKEKWQYIWLGDRIPETVEHARGHAQRLLSLAAQLLIPVLEVDQDFLSDAELFVLLSSIWLHDIGHGATTLSLPDGGSRTITRLPTLVRDLHHWLTFCMLKSGDSGYGLGDFLDAVAKVCLYHRGGMPVSDGQKGFQDKASGIEIKDPICEETEVRSNGTMYKLRTRLLASLLRLIDACDVQLERTVDVNYARARTELTRKEMEAELERMRRYGDIVSNCFNGRSPEWFQTISENIEIFIQAVSALVESGNKDFRKRFEEYEGHRKDLRNELTNALKSVWNGNSFNDEKLKGLLECWLECASTVIFKAEQDFHFLKHRQVRNVAIVPDGEMGSCGNGAGSKTGAYRFKVIIWPNDNPIGNLLEIVKEDIREEKELVKDNIQPICVSNIEIMGQQGG